MYERDDDTAGLRQFALELAFMDLLSRLVPADVLAGGAASFRERAAVARAENRAGLGVARKSLYGLDAPIFDIIAEFYEGAEAAARDMVSAPPAAASALADEPVVAVGGSNPAETSNITPFPRSVSPGRPT